LACGSIRPSTTSFDARLVLFDLVGELEDLAHRGRARADRLDHVAQAFSMRLAISISPSRVSSSTEPISRMYMRTGSWSAELRIHRGERGLGLLLHVLVGLRDGRGVGGDEQRFLVGAWS